MNNTYSLGGWAIEKIMVYWINQNIPKGSTILELGSGYGTASLVEKHKVYSVEQNLEWVNKIVGSNYIYAPLKNYGNYLWYDDSFIEKIKKIDYKLLLIDGPTEPSDWIDGKYDFIRNGILERINLFYNGSIIIVDDIERPEDLNLAKKLCSLLNKKSYNVGRNVLFMKGGKSFAIIK